MMLQGLHSRPPSSDSSSNMVGQDDRPTFETCLHTRRLYEVALRVPLVVSSIDKGKHFALHMVFRWFAVRLSKQSSMITASPLTTNKWRDAEVLCVPWLPHLLSKSECNQPRLVQGGRLATFASSTPRQVLVESLAGGSRATGCQ